MTQDEALKILLPNGPEWQQRVPSASVVPFPTGEGYTEMTEKTIFTMQLVEALHKLGLLMPKK